MLTTAYSLLAKLESTYLTDPSPVTGDAVEAWDVMFEHQTDDFPKNTGWGTPGQGASYKNTGVTKVTFKTYIKTNGSITSTESVFGKLLQMCGFSSTYVADTSYTYVPVFTGQKGGTLYFYKDGIKQEVNGARARIVNLTFTAGGLAIAEWEAFGLYIASAATALVAPTFEAGSPLITASADFELGASNNIDGIENFVISQAGLEVFKDINNAEGFGKALVTDNLFTGSIDPEVSTTDWTTFEAAREASTTYALNFVHGTGTGNIITITAPAVQLMNIATADRRGLVVQNIDLAFRVTSANGNPIQFAIT